MSGEGAAEMSLFLFVGYEVGSGEEVKIPIFHTLVTGQTQLSGKTTLLKALAKQASELGFKVLVIDSKSNIADFEGFGQEVPICLQESTDSLILISLLESIFRRRITVYYATLTRISEDAKTFSDVIENAEELKEKSSGFVRDACIALIDLLKRLELQTSKVKTSPHLTLPYPINRMAINEFDLQGQQLIVKTIFDEALRKFKKLIIVLDESYKMLPQKYSSACAKSILDFVTQSGATECYLWQGTQFLAPTSKDAMKTMAIKLLGTQDHDTECDHTLDLIPFIKGRFTKDTIMRLGLGHFILVTKTAVQTVYAVPEYADKNMCREVALGRRDPRSIHYLVPLSEEEMKEVKKGKKKEEPIEITIPPPEPPLSKKEEAVSITAPRERREPPRRERKHWAKPHERINYGERFELLENNVEGLRQRLASLEGQVKAAFSNTTAVGGMTLEQTTTNVKLQKVLRHVTISDETLRGKILTLAEENFFENWHPLREVVKALEDHKWAVHYGSVKAELVNMANDGLLGVKKRNRENYYALSPNIKFSEES